MEEEKSRPAPTLALSTKVEEDFVAPLTAIRGSLEILRDYDDLSSDERTRFLERALEGVVRLERSVEHLAASVYEAGAETHDPAPAARPPEDAGQYAARIKLLGDLGVIEIDFSDFVFKNSKIVNDFYDVIDHTIHDTGKDWYFVVNYRDCRIWPEAWVAFAHRGKRVKVTSSLGTVHYVERAPSETKVTDEPLSSSYDPDMFDSREAAFARIAELKRDAAD